MWNDPHLHVPNSGQGCTDTLAISFMLQPSALVSPTLARMVEFACLLRHFQSRMSRSNVTAMVLNIEVQPVA